MLSVAASEALVVNAKIVGMSKSAYIEFLIIEEEKEEVSAQFMLPEKEVGRRIKKIYAKPKEMTGFDAFWDAYPRKAAKKAAEDSYRKLSPDDRNAALSGLDPFKRWLRENEVEIEFVPHAATWLNNRRWEDELDLQKESSSHMFTSKDVEAATKAKAEADRWAEAQQQVARELAEERAARKAAGKDL